MLDSTCLLIKLGYSKSAVCYSPFKEQTHCVAGLGQFTPAQHGSVVHISGLWIYEESHYKHTVSFLPKYLVCTCLVTPLLL